MSLILETPEPPYYAVVFTAVMSADLKGYDETNRRLRAEAEKIPGFLGVETAGDDREHISVVYWKTLDAIEQWRNHADHRTAKKQGRARWYDRYKIRICRVETDSGFPGRP